MSLNRTIKAVLTVPGDKSISHRALIFSALSKGTIKIKGLSPAQDCQSTIDCLVKLGLKITRLASAEDSASGNEVVVESPGFMKLVETADVLDAGNSGTTMRILSGLVAGRPFTTRFDGDESLRNRPMSRVLSPLSEMGARITYQSEPDVTPIRDCAPFAIEGGNLIGQDFDLKLASAQVQTAVLLAGLQAKGTTSISMPSAVRDHTERMFRHMKVPFINDGKGRVSVEGLSGPVAPFSLSVPGDLSSAAFFMVAAACMPGSDLLLKNVGTNAGRRLVVDVLTQMGADLTFESPREVDGEPIADIRVRYNGRLKGATISGEDVASGIDEIPILALAGSLCDGTFTVSGAGELRHKESDRLRAIVEDIGALGISVDSTADGFVLEGVERLPGKSYWRTYNDHRMAMTGLIANALSVESLEVEEMESIKISYPNFSDHLKTILSDL